MIIIYYFLISFLAYTQTESNLHLTNNGAVAEISFSEMTRNVLNEASDQKKVERIDLYLKEYFEGRHRKLLIPNIKSLIALRAAHCADLNSACNDISKVLVGICTNPSKEKNDLEEYFLIMTFLKNNYLQMTTSVFEACTDSNRFKNVKLLLNLYVLAIRSKNFILQTVLSDQLNKYRLKQASDLIELESELKKIRESLKSTKPMSLTAAVVFAETIVTWIDSTTVGAKTNQEKLVFEDWMSFAANTLWIAGRAEKFNLMYKKNPSIISNSVEVLRLFCSYSTFHGNTEGCVNQSAASLGDKTLNATAHSHVKYQIAWNHRDYGKIDDSKKLILELYTEAKENKQVDFFPWIDFLNAAIYTDQKKYSDAYTLIKSIKQTWGNSDRDWSTHHLELLEQEILLAQGQYVEAKDLGESSLAALSTKIDGEFVLKNQFEIRNILAYVGLKNMSQAKLIENKLIARLKYTKDVPYFSHLSTAIINFQNIAIRNANLDSAAKLMGENHPDLIKIKLLLSQFSMQKN